MSSTGAGPAWPNSTQEDPPSYTSINPNAAPAFYPPVVAPGPQTSPPLLQGLPPGLAPLLQINQLTIRETFCSSQGRGRTFDVLNNAGQRVFEAEQEKGLLGPKFDVKLRDNTGVDLAQFYKPHILGKEMEVQCPPGCPIGTVKLQWNRRVTHLSIRNNCEEVLLNILGPNFHANIFGNATFEVKSSDERHVVGMMKMETDNYLVSFPLDLEVKLKVFVIGAALYLDSLIRGKRRSLEMHAKKGMFGI